MKLFVLLAVCYHLVACQTGTVSNTHNPARMPAESMIEGQTFLTKTGDKVVVKITTIDGVSTQGAITKGASLKDQYPSELVMQPGHYSFSAAVFTGEQSNSASFSLKTDAGKHYIVKAKSKKGGWTFWVEEASSNRIVANAI